MELLANERETLGTVTLASDGLLPQKDVFQVLKSS